jgi:hypothetical protein
MYNRNHQAVCGVGNGKGFEEWDLISQNTKNSIVIVVSFVKAEENLTSNELSLGEETRNILLPT